MEFALFAILPLALFSLFHRSTKAHAGFGFLAALAPVVASAVGGLINRKAGQGQQQRQIEYEQQQAAQEEAQRRAAFEAAQSSPQASLGRLGLNTRLAALLGQFGGREQTPQFILNAFDTARGPQEYTPGAEYIAPPKKGGGLFDYLGDLTGAASYFDVNRYNQGRQQGQAPGTGAPAAPQGPSTPAPGASGLLPSAIRGRQYFKMGETPAADEFLRQRGG